MSSGFIPAHGGQFRELAAKFGVPETSLIDFSASINPMPPSDSVIETLCELVRARKILTNYPDSEYGELKEAIAVYAGVDANTIVVGNGVMSLLAAALRALLIGRCLILVPGFGQYRQVLAASGAGVSTLTLRAEEGFSFDHESVLACLKSTSAQALLFANPHSPSGHLMPAAELMELQRAASDLGVTTIVDEAFIDYSPEESLSQAVAKSRSLVVLRSLTKIFSMPGLRVGYAVVHPGVRAALEPCIPAWSVTSIAAEAARLALSDQVTITTARVTNAVESRWLTSQLLELGIRVFPSAANYLLLKIDEGSNGHELWRRLIVEQRVVVRSCANFEGLDEHYFRVGVRTRAENQFMLTALAQSLKPGNR
jgi:threonine-phosphate decarboxylase